MKQLANFITRAETCIQESSLALFLFIQMVIVCLILMTVFGPQETISYVYDGF